MCHTFAAPDRSESLSRRVAAETLHAAANAFGLAADALVFVRDVANLVYAAGEPARVFLRLTHETDRTAPDVAAELAWLDFLTEHDLPACRPIVARDGTLCARPGEGFTAAAFAALPGRPCTDADFAAPLFREMGRFLGRLHRVSADYVPAAGAPDRLEWYELDSPERVLASWSPEDERLRARFREAFGRVRNAELPESRTGLVHGDLHRDNLLLHAGGIQVYDFDDCCRAPLAMDLAHALYYALWNDRYRPEEERSARAHAFLEALLAGYREEHSLPDTDIALFPDLLEVRELAVDAFSHRRERDDLDSLRRFAHVRARLAGDAPYVAVDWERFREGA